MDKVFEYKCYSIAWTGIVILVHSKKTEKTNTATCTVFDLCVHIGYEK